MIDSGKIAVIYPNANLLLESYLIAKRNGITIYDSIYISLAIKLGLSLETLDKKQREIFKNEEKRQPK